MHGALSESAAPCELGVSFPSLSEKEQELCFLCGHGLSQSLAVGVTLLWAGSPWELHCGASAVPHTPGRVLVEITDQTSLVFPGSPR